MQQLVVHASRSEVETWSDLLVDMDKLGLEELTDRVVEAVRATRSHYLRRRAASVLGAVRLRKAEQLLGELLRDPDWGTRANAVSSLRGSTSADSLEHILEALSDPSPEVRGEAVRVIGLRRAGHLPELTRLLSDDDQRVRTAAAGAVRRVLERA